MRTNAHTSGSHQKHRNRLTGRHGFTAIELMIAIGVMAATAGMTIPMFRQFQAQTDVDTATEHLVQALRAAQTLSQSGKSDSSWGVYFPEGTLFSGDEYAVRSEDHDVSFSIPASIETSGLDETSFTKIDGLPTHTGVVYVTSDITGSFRSITIDQNGVIVVSGIQEPQGGTGSSGGDSSSGGDTGGTSSGDTGGTTSGTSGGDTGGDTSGTTGGTSGGDTGGTSSGDTGGTTSGTSGGDSSGGDTGGDTSGTTGGTSSGDTGGDTSGTTGGTSGGGTSSSSSSSNSSSDGSGQCGLKSFSVHGSDCVVTGQYSSVTFECQDGAQKEIENETCRSSADLLTDANTYCEGHCSGNVSCEKRFTIDKEKGTLRSIGTNDVKFKILGTQSTYNSTNQKIGVRLSVSSDDGDSWSDLYGGKTIEGNEQETIENVASLKPLKIRVNGRYSWLFNKTFRSDGNDGHIVGLKKGDALPNYVQLRNINTLPSFIKKVVDAQGKVSIDAKEVLYLVELNALDSGARFADVAVLATFSEKAYSCSDSNKPRFKISFNRIKNTGNGNMKNLAFVGPQKVAFAEEQWIPLEDSAGNTIIDGGLVEAVPGFAIERGNHWVRIINHGSHANGTGKEIVDARILFNHAYIVSTQNEIEQNKSENPIDGFTNDTAEGDEFVDGPNTKSMTFKTRVTTGDDGVILSWLRDDVVAGSSSSTSSSSSSSASIEGVGDSCYVPYTVNNSTKYIELQRKSDVTVRIAGSEATYGKRGPKVSVRARITFDEGRSWQNISGGKSLRGSELIVYRDIAAGSKIALEYNGRYSWAFNRTAKSTDGNDFVKVLKKGQTIDGLFQSKSRGEMKKFLRDLVDDDAKMKVSDRDVVILGDLSDERTKSYKDIVTVISIDKARSDGGCGLTVSSSSSSTSQSSSSSSSSSDSGNADTDNDSVKNRNDWCPFDTKFPEAVPTEYMSFDRFALTATRGNSNSIPVFRTGPRKTVSNYSIKDLHGCSCAQILDAIEEKGYHRFSEHPVLFRQLKNLFGFVISNSRKFGCSNSLMQMIKGNDHLDDDHEENNGRDD